MHTTRCVFFAKIISRCLFGISRDSTVSQWLYSKEEGLQRSFLKRSTKQFTTVWLKQKNRGEDVLLCAHEAISSRWGISQSSQLHILAHPEYTPFKNVDSLLDKIKDDVMFVKKEDVLRHSSKAILNN